MPQWMLYAFSAAAVLAIALRGIFSHERMLGKILAANLTGTGTFLLFVAIARRAPEGVSDPVAHALVLTGIVVSVSATALALALLRRLVEADSEEPRSAQSADSAAANGERHSGG